MSLGADCKDMKKEKWRFAKEPKEVDPKLPSVLTGIGDIVLDDERLQVLIPNDKIRELVVAKEVRRGTVIPIKQGGQTLYAEPVRRPIFGRPVKSMNSMLTEAMIELNRILRPEKARRLGT